MRLVGVPAWFMLLLVAVPAFAQPDAEVNVAYQFATEGLAAFNSGSYPRSFDRFSRAFAIVRLPSLALYLARTSVKLGHLLAAREFYIQVGVLPDGLGDPEVQQSARVAALDELELLQSSIPRIAIRVPGLPLKSGVIQLDSATVPSDAAGAGWQVDPGLHRVTVLFGGRQKTQQDLIAEGESKTFVFVFPAPSTLGTVPAAQSRAPYADGRAAITHAGWASLAMGGTALALSGATTLWALAKHSELDKRGPWDVNNCEKAPSVGDCQSYGKLRTLATVGFYTGIVGVATGVTLLLLPVPMRRAPKHANASRLQPLLGIGYAGVQGQFD